MVLNADYQPLSYFPLSLWGWQDTVRAVFLDRVNIVAEYERRVSSSNFSMKLPSVISLKKYIPLKKEYLLQGLTCFSEIILNVNIVILNLKHQSLRLIMSYLEQMEDPPIGIMLYLLALNVITKKEA